MTTINEAYQAGIDAVVADNALNRGGFADAMRTVLTAQFSNAEATAWIDALAAEYNRLGIATQATYNRLRAHILVDPAIAREIFDALATTVNALPESEPALNSAQLIDLRDERDQINNAIDRLDVLIAAEPSGTVGRLVKDVMRDGKSNLRQFKESIRDAIRNITGDPDN